MGKLNTQARNMCDIYNDVLHVMHNLINVSDEPFKGWVMRIARESGTVYVEQYPQPDEGQITVYSTPAYERVRGKLFVMINGYGRSRYITFPFNYDQTTAEIVCEYIKLMKFLCSECMDTIRYDLMHNTETAQPLVDRFKEFI